MHSRPRPLSGSPPAGASGGCTLDGRPAAAVDCGRSVDRAPGRNGVSTGGGKSDCGHAVVPAPRPPPVAAEPLSGGSRYVGGCPSNGRRGGSDRNGGRRPSGGMPCMPEVAGGGNRMGGGGPTTTAAVGGGEDDLSPPARCSCGSNGGKNGGADEKAPRSLVARPPPTCVPADAARPHPSRRAAIDDAGERPGRSCFTKPLPVGELVGIFEVSRMSREPPGHAAAAVLPLLSSPPHRPAALPAPGVREAASTAAAQGVTRASPLPPNMSSAGGRRGRCPGDHRWASGLALCSAW